MAINVALIGVGNCVSSLVQAITLAKQGGLDTGLSHKKMGAYAVEDINFVAAFDVDSRKLHLDLAEAIFAPPNCTTKYLTVPKLGVSVSPGPLLDGVASHMTDVIAIAPETESVSIQNVADILKAAKAEILVSYLPVGSVKASEAYAEAALKAKCAFINCTPAVIATSTTWCDRFKNAGLPLLGDDIKSQIGSTAIHRALISILEKKGVTVTSTYQLNIGGNTDFMNMRNPERGQHKKKTKEVSLNHLFKNSPDLGVGPSDYVPQLKDHKVGYIHMEGIGLLNMPFSLELRLKVEDSPNSAGIVLNAIRAAKIALDKNESGPIKEVCASFFKNPAALMKEDETFDALHRYLENCSDRIAEEVN